MNALVRRVAGGLDDPPVPRACASRRTTSSSCPGRPASASTPSPCATQVAAMPSDPIDVAVGPQQPPVSEEAAASARELALRVVRRPVEVTVPGPRRADRARHAALGAALRARPAATSTSTSTRPPSTPSSPRPSRRASSRRATPAGATSGEHRAPGALARRPRARHDGHRRGDRQRARRPLGAGALRGEPARPHHRRGPGAGHHPSSSPSSPPPTTAASPASPTSSAPPRRSTAW